MAANSNNNIVSTLRAEQAREQMSGQKWFDEVAEVRDILEPTSPSSPMKREDIVRDLAKRYKAHCPHPAVSNATALADSIVDDALRKCGAKNPSHGYWHK